MNTYDVALEESKTILDSWLESCRRKGGISRNTIGIGIVVLDHLLRKCPVSRDDVISSGGEVKGARSGLSSTLERYGIPDSYLKEATTRQSHQDGQRLFDAFGWGEKLKHLSEDERKTLLLQLISGLASHALAWLQRQNLKLDIDRRQTPTAWISLVVENAEGRSGGIVEQHLVGAKLERRFKGKTVSNHPARAADQQTARDGDFAIAQIVYHVTAAPSGNVIAKCARNIRAGLHPILLVPTKYEYKAKALAEEAEIDKELTIISIESFVALNIIELALEENKDFYSILQEIIDVYNRRLTEVETDISLKIEVR
jgi:hypothetical protein